LTSSQHFSTKGVHDPAPHHFHQFTQLIKARSEAKRSQGQEFTVNDIFDLTNRDPEVRQSFAKLKQTFLNTYKAHYGVFPTEPLKPPIRVAVTGASGAIAYSLLFRLASGEIFGPDQPIILNLLELPLMLNSLKAVIMELNDCAFPLLYDVLATDNARDAFKAVQYALLVGAKPRTKGQERSDLLKANAEIFVLQGKILDEVADRENLKVLVVGNPANTNALIAASNAPNIDPCRFTAMTKLDHSRGLFQLANKTGAQVSEISRFAIWGNHSATQYPDISHTQIRGQPAKSVLGSDADKWVKDYFIPTVQQRGAAVINARGGSSAASAASAALDHTREWHNPVGSNGRWTAAAVLSEGQYGVSTGLYYSFPLIADQGKFFVVPDLSIDQFSAERLEATQKELIAEREAVVQFLPKKL